MAATASSLTIRTAKTVFVVGQRTAENRFNCGCIERLQHEHLGAREQRGVHLERGVLRRRTDQGDVPGFDARKERVLLRLVEAVDFVDEYDRSPAAGTAAQLRSRHHLLDFLDAHKHRAELDELRLCHVRDDSRQRRLARAGRSPEDD
jgi:hypothetical protein